MKETYGRELARVIKGAIGDAAEVEITEERNTHYGQRTIVIVRRLAGGRPIIMARRHPDLDFHKLPADELGHRFAKDYGVFR